uniref:BSD domain-containing protein n=1 Tax=Spumella elongata TaxID=89044 RepID=A0A7S3GP68_9STRA
MKLADDFTESLVSQANEAQEQIQREQAKLREEDELKKVTLSTNTQLPWETTDESLQILSDALMDSILKLSLNELNFTTVPANAEEIVFVFSDFIATALHLLKIDANLAHVHSKVSPKMDEELFWRNYYSRVIYLRAKCGIDGSAAQEASAQWNNAKIVFEPDYAQVLTRATSKVSSDYADNPTTLDRTGKKSPAGGRNAGSSHSKNNSSSNLFTSHGEVNTSDPLRDSVDLDDLDELDFTTGGAKREGEEEGEEEGGAAAAEGGAGGDDEDVDVDLGDLDLADLDDEMDLLRELREMEEEEEAEQQEQNKQLQQQQGQDKGKGNSKKGREVGELGSYEDVGKSDCNSSSAASNAELEAQIAAELANISDDDEDL